jgi:hypothetical protein
MQSAASVSSWIARTTGSVPARLTHTASTPCAEIFLAMKLRYYVVFQNIAELVMCNSHGPVQDLGLPFKGETISM